MSFLLITAACRDVDIGEYVETGAVINGRTRMPSFCFAWTPVFMVSLVLEESQ